MSPSCGPIAPAPRVAGQRDSRLLARQVGDGRSERDVEADLAAVVGDTVLGELADEGDQPGYVAWELEGGAGGGGDRHAHRVPIGRNDKRNGRGQGATA